MQTILCSDKKSLGYHMTTSHHSHYIKIGGQ
jgi:hypothetical protein